MKGGTKESLYAIYQDLRFEQETITLFVIVHNFKHAKQLAMLTKIFILIAVQH